jgi:mannonate dehydratase
LRDIRQAGVTDIVTALHHVPCGTVWTDAEVSKRAREVSVDPETGRASGLAWTVAESLPIHEDIKKRSGPYKQRIEDYKAGVESLARSGVKVICYNFMPVLDWTRTQLELPLPDGSKTLFFDKIAMAAFDMHILKRPGAEAQYPPAVVEAAKTSFESMSEDGKKRLADNILLGLPGTVDDLTVPEFQEMLDGYKGVDDKALRSNLYYFLNEIMPACERLGVRMAIHPDDPPMPIFGLPRIMSTEADVRAMESEVKSRNAGLTLCSGSFGGRKDNDVPGIFERHADRVHFAHFRNVSYEPGRDDAFHESGQLKGNVDMARLMAVLIREEDRRRASGDADWEIHVRPDHGKLFDRDAGMGSYPGYSFIGRAIGLAELRGLELGLRSAMGSKG